MARDKKKKDELDDAEEISSEEITDEAEDELEDDDNEDASDVEDDGGDADESDVEDDDEDDEEEEEAAAKPEPKKKSAKSKAKPAKKSAKTKKKADEPEVEPQRPWDESGERADTRDLFGLDDKGEEDSLDEYESDAQARLPVASLLGVIVVLGLLVGGSWYAMQVLKTRQAELDETERIAMVEAEASKVPTVRYGNLAFLASTPPKALILQNGQPIYAKTMSGAWTELRTGPSTRVQNIKIEEETNISFTLMAEGYKPYELTLTPYDWVKMQATGDWEKVFHNIRLEPAERQFLPNCTEIQQIGLVYQDVCKYSATDEISTRSDYERIYDARLEGTMSVDSNPPVAKIFFLTKELQKADGVQAITPYDFTVYGKDLKGEDKKVKITDELSVRLELDGYEPYLTTIYPHQWKCTAVSNLDAVKAIQVPEKWEKNTPDMPHHICQYSYEVTGVLKKPDLEAEARKKEAEEKGVEKAPAH